MKTVVITGATRGVGLALAHKYIKNNYKVVGLYYKSTESALKLEKLGARMIRCNVSCEDSVTKAFNLIKKEFNCIDLVINNAGVCLPQKLAIDVTLNEFNKVVGTNLKGLFLVTKQAIPNMLSSGGKIINISSVLAVAPASCEAVYSMTKAGVLAFTNSVAKEMENSPIELCSVILGLVDTDMNKHLTQEEKLEFISNFGLKKIPSPKVVANKIFSISQKAGINGKTFRVYAGKVVK